MSSASSRNQLAISRKRLASPGRAAQKAMRQAKEYEEKMINRVNYLQKEEQRFLKKIVETREEAER